MTDRELIRKVQSGSKEAMNDIIQKYYDDIYRFCLYLTSSEAESYDITQDVFLRFIKYADTYEYKNLKGYLLIIARNLSRDYLRKRKIPTELGEIREHGKEDDSLRKAEEDVFFREILNEIPEEQRLVIILRIQEELKFKEVAEIAGCSISTAKSRFRLGIQNLRKEMGRING